MRSARQDITASARSAAAPRQIHLKEKLGADPDEIEVAYFPLPLYYRTCECGILEIEPGCAGCVFEVIEDESEVLSGSTMWHTPRHSVGHMAVTVTTSAGDAVICGDAIFQARNLEPNLEEKWRYWVPARSVNSYEGWKSVEEIDKRADYVLPCHDEAGSDHPVYPFEGMQLRERRKVIPGLSFYFGDMPAGAFEAAGRNKR